MTVKLKPANLVIWTVTCLLAVAAPAFAQSDLTQFTVDGRPVQVHGFVSQGFIYSNNNNYLTMPTSTGSFALSDLGLNMSMQVTDKFRVGAQAYSRNVGELGKGQVVLDWALGDYRFNDWIGVRAGKVKTVFGLYNETQDMEFLHTWALLPQALYPLDLRGSSIAHVGGDVYGAIPLSVLGRLSYTVFAGRLSDESKGGHIYGLRALGVNTSSITGSTRGGDVRWNTPVTGLLVGGAYMEQPVEIKGINENFGPIPNLFIPYLSDVKYEKTVYFGQFARGNWKLDAEYSRELQLVTIFSPVGPFGPPKVNLTVDTRAWYAAAAYRVSKHLEIGTYHSRYFPNINQDYGGLLAPTAGVAPHIFDQAVTARIDITNHWDLKVEGHFMDGTGDPTSFRGFYPQNNPTGLKPKTNLLVIRMGFNL